MVQAVDDLGDSARDTLLRVCGDAQARAADLLSRAAALRAAAAAAAATSSMPEAASTSSMGVTSDTDVNATSAWTTRAMRLLLAAAGASLAF